MPEHDDLRDMPIFRELGASIHAAARAEDQKTAQATRPASRWGLRRWTLPTVGIAVAGAAAVVVISSSVGGPGSTPSADAAVVLKNAAAVAAAQDEAFPRPDQFFYVKSQVSGRVIPAAEGASAAAKDGRSTASVREIWTSVERRGRLVQNPTDGGPATTPASGTGIAIGAQGSYRLGSISLPLEQLQSYPTDPVELYQRLRAGAAGRGDSIDGQIVDDIGEALGEQPIPAGLRGGLYRTLARIPGVEVTSHGSASTTVSLTVKGARHELTFDPRTAELDAAKTIAVDGNPDGLKAGEVITATTFEDRAVTDTTTAP